MTPPSECPVCGAAVPPKARACPGCGADERTGWDEETTRSDGLDLPGGSFDYDETLKNEGLKPRAKPAGVSVFWWVVGLGLVLLLIAGAVGLRA
jgi:hypothetical protein